MLIYKVSRLLTRNNVCFCSYSRCLFVSTLDVSRRLTKNYVFFLPTLVVFVGGFYIFVSYGCLWL